MSFEFINTHLDERKAQQLLRKRYVVQSATARTITVNDKTYLNFASNDYLGFGDSPVELTSAPLLGSHSSA